MDLYDIDELKKEYIFSDCDGGIVITHYKGNSSNVVIPESIGGRNVVAIGDRAFASREPSFSGTVRYSREERLSVTVPDTVKSIGSGAFYGCTNLKSINIPKSLEEVGEFAFLECYGLEYFILPEEITRFESNALSAIWNNVYCKEFESIYRFKYRNLLKTDLSCILLASLVKYSSRELLAVPAISDRVRLHKRNIAEHAITLDDAFALEKLLSLSVCDSPDELEWYIALSSEKGAVQCIAFLLNYKNVNFTCEELEDIEKKRIEEIL